MKIKVGVIGLGSQWDTRHGPALRSLADRFEVRAVFDEVSQRARCAAAEFGAAATDGFRSLAFRDDIDAVLVLSRTWAGPLPLAAACSAGKAIYCVSALDFDVDQARQLKERVNDAGSHLWRSSRDASTRRRNGSRN